MGVRGPALLGPTVCGYVLTHQVPWRSNGRPARTHRVRVRANPANPAPATLFLGAKHFLAEERRD